MNEELEYRLKFKPETYKTLTGKNYVSDTNRRILNRDLNRMLREQTLSCASLIQHKNKGMERVFYHFNKEYKLVFTIDFFGKKRYYYCAKIIINPNVNVKMLNAFLLEGCKWTPKGNLSIYPKRVERII